MLVATALVAALLMYLRNAAVEVEVDMAIYEKSSYSSNGNRSSGSSGA